MGERCPLWDPEARGVIFGLSFLHTRGHLIRAMMEGVGFAIRHNISLLQKKGIKMRSPMKLVEGGAKSDITGLDTVYLGETQGAPIGDTVMAGVGVKVFKGYEIIRNWLKPEAENRVNKKVSPIYEALFEKYMKIYPALKKLF